MSHIQTIFLALIQGLTEFLPISSSAHLILPSQLLGWNDQGILFDVCVHFGTLLAVIIYFRKEIYEILVKVMFCCKTHKSTALILHLYKCMLYALITIYYFTFMLFLYRGHIACLPPSTGKERRKAPKNIP